jgi:ParB/RepB/Spo0J family partition protein
MKEYRTIYEEIPIEYLIGDTNQPRKIVEVDKALLASVKERGIQTPLIVMKINDTKFIILDGHRRRKAGQLCNIKKIWCKVYLDPLTAAEAEIIRYQVQNVRKNWTPPERSNSIYRIKQEKNLKDKELAELLNVSTTLVSNSIQLRELKADYMEKFLEYGLKESYRVEFLRLKPKLTNIRNFDIDDIIDIIFKKVKRKVIKSSKEIRKLGRVFNRASANEKELFNFLSNEDVTVNDLDRKTIVSGFSFRLLQLIEDLKARKSKGIKKYDAKEQVLVDNLTKLL